MLYTGKLVVKSEGEINEEEEYTRSRQYYEEDLGIPFPEELEKDESKGQEITTMKVQFFVEDIAKLIENKTWVNGEHYPVTIVQFYSGEQMMFDDDFDKLAALRQEVEHEKNMQKD